MPQAKYYLVHWGASFNDAKKEVALSCIKHHRMGLYTDVAVAPDFINEPIRPIADLDPVDARKVVLGKSVVSRHLLIGRQHRFMCQPSWSGYRWR